MGRTGGQGSFEFHGDSQTEVGGQGGREGEALCAVGAGFVHYIYAEQGNGLHLLNGS